MLSIIRRSGTPASSTRATKWSTPSKLLGDYLAWARDNNEGAISSGEFREMVERRPGLKYVKNNGTRMVRGITIRPDRDAMARDRARFGDRDDDEEMPDFAASYGARGAGWGG